MVGITYSLWTYGYLGGTNTLQTGNVSLKLLESTSEIIDIKNALPKGDNEGKTQEETFNFAVTTKASRNTAISYSINIEKLEVDEGYTSLEDKDIKVYLEDYNNKEIVAPSLISNIGTKLYSKTNIHNSSNKEITDKYKLRVWLDKEVDISNWTKETKLEYKFKIGVNTENTSNHRITFDTDGGEMDTFSKTVTFGNNYGELPIPTKEGYTFKGWNGKNLLNIDAMLTSDTLIKNDDGSYTLSSHEPVGNRFSNYMRLFLEKNTNIVLSYNLLDYSGNYALSLQALIVFEDGTNSTIGIYRNSSYTSRVYNKKIKDIKLYQEGDQPIGTFTQFEKLQLEKGTTSSEYEPYFITSTTPVTINSDHVLKAIWKKI